MKNCYKTKDGCNRNEIDIRMFSEWFNEYKRLGGKHDEEVFSYYLNVFFASTCIAFTGGDVLSRDICYKKWIKFIGSNIEANLYFRAVDNITAYT